MCRLSLPTIEEIKAIVAETIMFHLQLRGAIVSGIQKSSGAGSKPPNPSCRDPDHYHRIAVHQQLSLSNDAGVAAELVLPSRVTENNHWLPARRWRILGDQRSASIRNARRAYGSNSP